MRWESTNSTSANEVYQLFNDDKKLLTLSINSFSNTARVECNKEKRIFLIRKEGFRRNKTVLRTEYGFKIGELGTENNQTFIIVNDEKFFYNIHNNPTPELILYKDSEAKPFVVCNLNTQSDSTVNILQHPTLTDAAHPGLLMALCWYMFLPVSKENPVELVS